MAKKIGGNQRASRKSKLDFLANGNVMPTISFDLGETQIVLKGNIERRDSGYFLSKHNIQIPIKSVKFDKSYTNLSVAVEKGSYAETQLKKIEGLG